jgi:hypothetical protein
MGLFGKLLKKKKKKKINLYFFLGKGGQTSFSFSNRILHAFFIFMCLILVETYTANLTSNLLANNQNVLLKGIDDLRTNSKRFVVVNNSFTNYFFKYNTDYSLMSPLMEVVNTNNLAIQYLLDGTVDAFVS